MERDAHDEYPAGIPHKTALIIPLYTNRPCVFVVCGCVFFVPIRQGRLGPRHCLAGTNVHAHPWVVFDRAPVITVEWCCRV